MLLWLFWKPMKSAQVEESKKIMFPRKSRNAITFIECTVVDS